MADSTTLRDCTPRPRSEAAVEGQADPASDISSMPRPVGLVGHSIRAVEPGLLSGSIHAGRAAWSSTPNAGTCRRRKYEALMAQEEREREQIRKLVDEIDIDEVEP